MDARQTAESFGLIVVGNEVLDGRVADQHIPTCRRLLGARRIGLRYALILPDEPAAIEAHLAWAERAATPFFCCGGIGSTPDDYTRGCAARVAGVPLAPHPEGVAILRQRFGPDINPGRLRLVEFPAGCTLIPNPFNRVPGFKVGRGYYLPGFPEMAGPMMEWVLDTCYTTGPDRIACALLLPGAREGDLVDLMERFVAAHPDLVFSSLPRFTANRGTEVRLGLSGPRASVESGRRHLTDALDEAHVPYRTDPPAESAS